LFDIARYHGTDIAGFVLTFISLQLLGSKRRSGFLVGAASGVCWGAFSYLAESLPTLVANGVFLLMNLRGWWRWRHAEGA